MDEHKSIEDLAKEVKGMQTGSGAEKKLSPDAAKAEQSRKNMISAIILLAGLFIGSLFVDVAQLLKGTGFSEKNLSQSEIFAANGKTWVAYDEPIVNVSVISDDACGDKCDPSDVLVWLRRVMPTISAQKINYNTPAAKNLIDKFGIKTLPAYVFSDAVAKTNFYSQAQVIFDAKDNQYALKTDQLGVAPGKYLATPAVDEGDATFGKADSAVKVVVFSDFQCPYCKSFWSTLRDTMQQYGDRVLFDYKHLPLAVHAQANNAALASLCAQEQGKFWEYGDKLFASQDEWANTTDTQKFKDYAQGLGLDSAKFNACLDSKKYQSQIDASTKEANDIGLSGTPAIFINSQYKNGVVSADELKTAIDTELGK